jgi:hypothetical protein
MHEFNLQMVFLLKSHVVVLVLSHVLVVEGVFVEEVLANDLLLESMVEQVIGRCVSTRDTRGKIVHWVDIHIEEVLRWKVWAEEVCTKFLD